MIETVPAIRIARPTDHIDTLLPFYLEGLGLELLYRFEDHDGFDGAMVGAPGAPYHFEFTVSRGHPAGRAPSQDHLVIFYLPDASEWQAAVDRMAAAKIQPVPSFNPYWDRSGLTFEDADGYRVVLQRSAWPM